MIAHLFLQSFTTLLNALSPEKFIGNPTRSLASVLYIV